MLKGLLGCEKCGFVTRANSYLGSSEACPKCEGKLREMGLIAARRLIHQKRRAQSLADPAPVDLRPGAQSRRGPYKGRV